MTNQNLLHPPFPHLDLVFIQGHQGDDYFTMGDDNSEYEEERPAHNVTIKSSFYMAQYPVTQALYREVMDENPACFKGDKRPVESVSWKEAKVFIVRLNERKEIGDWLKDKMPLGRPGWKFRLPSEAEWEFAVRGGIHPQGYTYCGSDELKQVGWYRENSGRETKPVGLLLPNKLGLYDMSGNVYEWCEDDWHEDYEQPGRPDDGGPWKDGDTAESRSTNRVFRGGLHFDSPVGSRPAFHVHNYHVVSGNYIGLRLVLSLQSGSPSAFL